MPGIGACLYQWKDKSNRESTIKWYLNKEDWFLCFLCGVIGIQRCAAAAAQSRR